MLTVSLSYDVSLCHRISPYYYGVSPLYVCLCCLYYDVSPCYGVGSYHSVNHIMFACDVSVMMLACVIMLARVMVLACACVIVIALLWF